MEYTEDEIRIDEIWSVIKKGLVFIIITSLLFASASFVITKYFISKSYTSTVKLYIETETISNNSYDNLQSYNYAEKLVATYMQMLDTQMYYSVLSQELNEKYTPSQLSGMVTYTAVEGTEIFEASVVAGNPADAKKIADALVKTAPKRISGINDKANLKIVDEPLMPMYPTSPNTYMNVMIAFLIGCIISIAILFVRKRIDKKIKYTQDMTTICDLPILAAIPDFNLSSNGKLAKEAYVPSHGQEYED